jgi:hypothetical protein
MNLLIWLLPKKTLYLFIITGDRSWRIKIVIPWIILSELLFIYCYNIFLIKSIKWNEIPFNEIN